METIRNKFGEIQTKWQSHKHPDNPDFMQIVNYMHIERADGRKTLYWSLANSSPNDKHSIFGISIEDAKQKFTDAP